MRTEQSHLEALHASRMARQRRRDHHRGNTDPAVLAAEYAAVKEKVACQFCGSTGPVKLVADDRDGNDMVYACGLCRKGKHV